MAVTVVTAITLAALVAGICSRGAKAPGPTAQPTIGPSVTAVATATAAAPQTATAYSPIQVAIPACKASPPGTFVGGAGTIPGPTPTEPPPPAPRTADESREAVRTYWERTGPIVNAAQSWVMLTEDKWSGATTREQADLVLVESTRLGVLCTATSAVDIDRELRDAHLSWVGALTARQAWASEVANALGCCGRADTLELEALRGSTADAVFAAATRVEETAAKYGPLPAASIEYRISNERLEIRVIVPPGWVVARNDTQLALIADRSIQLETDMGFGVDESNLGTGVRIRRLRKSADWTLEGAVDQAKAALSNLGSERSRRALTLDGALATELLLVPQDEQWATRLVVAGADDSAYFFEMGCPRTFDDACGGRFQEILEDVHFGRQ